MKRKAIAADSAAAIMLSFLRVFVLRRIQFILRSTGSVFNRLADLVAPKLTHDQRVHPVLCFGDSITEGYFNIWPHAKLAPQRPALPPNVNAHEHASLLCHPYSIRLGQLLAHDVGDGAGGYKDSLRYARSRAYSGWTAEELLPMLRRSLREGPWRCVVIMAGVNDVIWRQASTATVLAHLEELYAACDEAGVPVIALTNLEADLGEFFTDPIVLAERQKALADVAEGVLQMRRRRVVADTRKEVPLNDDFFDDAVHPKPTGSVRLADCVFQAIKFHGL